LASYRTTHARCLVVFDRVGCGAEQLSREELEAEVDAQLEKTGWKCRAVIVIDPELENWVWGRSPHVATVLGWVNPQQEVRQWLLEQGFLADAAQVKPDRPKEAMEAVLKKVRQPRSSSICRALAERVTLEGCTEPSFVKLCLTLRHWFSVRSESPQSS